MPQNCDISVWPIATPSAIIVNIGFPGQFRKFFILFDEGVIQIREINLGHEIGSSNLYFGHSNSHLGQEI